jgi:plasmid maintenance system antidote protein VapI
MSDVLRQAIVDSGKPLLQLAGESGVVRQSIMYFVRGERSMVLDKADRLAEVLGLELRHRRPRRKRKG